MNQKNKGYHYDKEELKTALAEVGVQRGGVVFSHIGMGFLGYPKEGSDLDTMFSVIYNAFREVLGEEGTFLVPVYTYSFCKNEPFNVQNSQSSVGAFTEKFRKLPNVKRSIEPIFSVAGIGPMTEELFKDLPMECFGSDCIYERLVKANASICNIGVGFRYATFVHYVEQTVGVPYRFKKVFAGDIIENDNRRHAEIVYYVRTGVGNESTFPDLGRLEEDAYRSGYLKSKNIGKGIITNISCRHLYDLCVRGVNKDPWFLARCKNKF